MPALSIVRSASGQFKQILQELQAPVGTGIVFEFDWFFLTRLL
jgi:hypothetical protein